jgi:hypothetical protein
MNGEACDYTSVTEMIQQTWPGDDDYSRNIVGRLTADSGAVAELAEALDERSAAPEDAWVMFGETVGKLSGDDLDSIADWLDGAEVLTHHLHNA